MYPPTAKALKAAILPFTNNSDKRNGTPNADRLDGLSGNDTIAGLSGNDTLIGSDGNDSLNGGVGNDALSGGNGRDTLLGDSGNDYLDGGSDDDSLAGGDGQDSFFGGLGTDTLIGGNGNDLYQVDDVTDKLVEANSAAGGKDSVKASVSYALTTGLENILLSGEADLAATGNALPNQLFGNNGNNLLTGLDGNDSLAGGLGDDTLNGGTGINRLLGGDGSDTYVINNNQDRISELAGEGDNDSVQSSAGFTLPDNVETLTLTGGLVIDGNGNALDNGLEGNAAANQLSGKDGDDTLSGNAGDDRLDGGTGSDALDGGAGNDTARYSGPQDDYDAQYDAASDSWTIQNISNGDIDQLANVEFLQFSDATVNIAAGPPQPTLTVSDVKQAEGNSGTSSVPFTLNLSTAGFLPVSVDYATLGGTATAVQDYSSAAGTVTFAPGETSKTVEVTVLGDTTVEADETFRLVLSNADGVKLGNNSATATLVNDDLPTLSISDATATEGNGGTSKVTLSASLSAASSVPVTVNYATGDGSAVSTSDYSVAAGKLTFAPGETSKNITLTVKGDTTVETDETFRVTLATPTNASLSANADSATVTIKNDDLPVLSIAGATVAEGNNTGVVGLTVTLSAASTQTVTVNYATADSTAKAGSDYTATSGTLSFAPGETSKTLTVPILGDALLEANEAFQVALSAPVNAGLSGNAGSASVTITNDDQPTVSLAAVAVNEGDSNNTAAVTVSLSGAYSQTVTVNYASADGTALAGSDYTAVSGTLTFPAGTTSQTFNVPVLGDTDIEADETVALQLSSPSGATLGTASAVLTLKNDDLPPPVVSIALTNATITEGNSGSSNATVTVSLSRASTQTVIVDYAGENGTAGSGSDYSAVAGTLSFAPGETSKTIDVAVLGDGLLEPDEDFRVVLSSPSNATLSGTSSVTITIANDDQGVTFDGLDLSMTANADTFTGTPSNDRLLGLAGNDSIDGNDGRDSLVGGADNDTLIGSGGHDTLEGDDGNDSITGGDGTDSLTGDLGNDTLAGGNDADTLSGGDGSDLLYGDNESYYSSGGNYSDVLDGGQGDDTLDGGDGDNSLTGDAGNDSLRSGSGNDTLTGDEGNDSLDAGDGKDTLSGGDGSDSMYGDSGSDILTGGVGDDTLDGGNGNDSEEGGEGNDYIRDNDGNDTLMGGVGEDIMYAGRDNDVLQGGEGDDWLGYSYNYYGSQITDINYYEYGSDNLDGGGGNDHLNGGYDADSLLGGEGNDVLYGNASSSSDDGADTLLGGAGTDTLDGSAGADNLSGGSGVDTLTGGADNDRFIFNIGDSGVGTGNRDVITDFYATSTSEVIDLSALSSGVLTFNSSAAFSAAGQVRYVLDFTNQITVVQLNLDADLAADVEIQLTGLVGLSAGDFVL